MKRAGRMAIAAGVTPVSGSWIASEAVRIIAEGGLAVQPAAGLPGRARHCDKRSSDCPVPIESRAGACRGAI
jgi:hypothetical protein